MVRPLSIKHDLHSLLTLPLPPPQFMRDRLRIRDVQLYIRDLLIEYAKLQRFTPVQSAHARCMDWQRLLLEFEWPHYSEVSRTFDAYW